MMKKKSVLSAILSSVREVPSQRSSRSFLLVWKEYYTLALLLLDKGLSSNQPNIGRKNQACHEQTSASFFFFFFFPFAPFSSSFEIKNKSMHVCTLMKYSNSSREGAGEKKKKSLFTVVSPTAPTTEVEGVIRLLLMDHIVFYPPLTRFLSHSTRIIVIIYITWLYQYWSIRVPLTCCPFFGVAIMFFNRPTADISKRQKNGQSVCRRCRWMEVTKKSKKKFGSFPLLCVFVCVWCAAI